MKTSNAISRRNFIGKAAMMAGFTTLLGGSAFEKSFESSGKQEKLRK